MKKQNINLYLASPRGFCAGVDRAVKIVEESIKKFGAPVYVRHEIVHNKDVVNSLATLNKLINVIEPTGTITFNLANKAYGVYK